jgi:hypothetical protein
MARGLSVVRAVALGLALLPLVAMADDARQGLSLFVQAGAETGAAFDASDYQFGLVYDHRWFELRWAPLAFTSFRDRPADVLADQFGGWRPRVAIAGPWRLAPFIEGGSDALDSGEAHGGGDGDPTDTDLAIGLRWRVDAHWTVSLYRREYDFHDVDRVAPLPQRERLEAATTGLAVSWRY